MQGWFDKLTTNGEGADAVVVVRRPTTNAVDFRSVRPDPVEGQHSRVQRDFEFEAISEVMTAVHGTGTKIA